MTDGLYVNIKKSPERRIAQHRIEQFLILAMSLKHFSMTFFNVKPSKVLEEIDEGGRKEHYMSNELEKELAEYFSSLYFTWTKTGDEIVITWK